ncbi:hypothetical protein P9112_003976 [Eukaryota sp. TZLM1-RC]
MTGTSHPTATSFSSPVDASLSKTSIRSRHRKEIEALNQAFASLLSSIPKSDKKQRKQVSKAQSTELEALKKLQQSQLSSLSSNVVSSHSLCEDDEIDAPDKPRKKKNRRRKQDIYDQLSLEAERHVAEQGPSPGELEWKAIEMSIEDKGMVIRKVPADGNCLFNAICNQLYINRGVSITSRELRLELSKYLCQNKDDLYHFVDYSCLGNVSCDCHDFFDCDCGRCQSLIFDRYVKSLASDPSFWGGDLEIKMVCDLFKVRVIVYQAGLDPLIFGNSQKVLYISLHKKLYSSGNHYNELLFH